MIFYYIDPSSGYVFTGLGGWLVSCLLTIVGFLSLLLKNLFKNKRPLVALLILILFITFIMTNLIKHHKILSFNKKIVILAFDGLSPQIIERMLSAGQLPHFARLKELGSYQHLKTSNPAQSPVAWASFATGQNPGKHGIYDFVIRDPKTYNLNLSLSKITGAKPQRIIQTKTFWQYSSEAAVPTTIIGHPLTFPPDQIKGRMSSGMGVPDILGTEGTFTFYTSEPLDQTKDIGGNVFHVEKSRVIPLNLIGPLVKNQKLTQNVTVPFKVLLEEGQPESISIDYQGQIFKLKTGEWSDWQDVAFQIDFFKKIKGIFKFYLVETSPEFKLYISPINFDPREPFYPVSYPKEYSREIADQIGLYHTMGMPVDTWAVNEKRLSEKPLLEQISEILKEKKAMLAMELNRFPKGLLFCYFENPDIVQHMFWRFTDPQHPLYKPEEATLYKNTIDRWYQYMDEILGDVMQRISADDTLIVLSDHGFNTFRRTVHVNSWLRKNGYLELKNPLAPSGAELFGDIDWTKTKAYACGFGAIYLNQKGREKEGIVEPGQESQQLKNEISQKLEQWIDDQYKSRVINKVYSKENIFWGPQAKNAPDLYIGFKIGYCASWQTAIGGVPSLLIEDNLKKWSGSHLFDPTLVPGIIFSNKIITKENPSLLDVTPTILKVLGYTSDEIKKFDFDGKALF